MRHIIYRITNTVNGKYYIGRHSTKNLDDGYLGSGKGIMNAVNKYGKNAFTKEIIAEAFSSEDLWEIEKEIVNEEVVKDNQSYNMAYGGKHYLHGLKQYNKKAFLEHQSNAGKIGAQNLWKNKTATEKKNWHSAGGKASVVSQKKNGHPFYDSTAAKAGGKAVKGMIELWHPEAIATNKNQKEYRSGDNVKALPDSEKFNQLRSQGWLLIEEHKNKLQK